LLLWLWIALHAVGLLSMFGKPGAIDRYAALLHGAPWLLWPMRAGLVLFAAVHVTGSMLLARRARAALRGRSRGAVRYSPTSFASRSMRLGGAGLLVFVVLHVLHMTIGVLHPSFVPGHVAANLARGLASPLVACGYIAAAVTVGLHVLHGLWSAPRSLGIGEHTARKHPRPVVALVALALVLGFAAVPIAVLAGVLR
jgi:succinate dehydrogenase / fumarate reductase cytochrome b subunit